MLLRKPFLKTFHCLWILQASQVEKIEELWDPKLKIQNLEEIKGGRDEKWHTIKLGEVDPVVVYRRRLKGSFYENMELKDFPRDVQVKKKMIVVSAIRRGSMKGYPACQLVLFLHIPD